MRDDTDVFPGFDAAVCRGGRAMLGLSQQELCDIAGIGRKLLNDFENGLVVPKASKLADIVGALERSGAVFVRINGITAVGMRAGAAGSRSARGRAFAEGASGTE